MITSVPLAGIRIDQVDVGQWVLAENPLEADDLEFGLEVVPDEWRLLELRAPKTDGSYADVRMLRPAWWLEQQWHEQHQPQVLIEVVLNDDAGAETSLVMQLDDHRDPVTGEWREQSPFTVPAYAEQQLVGGTLFINVPECGIQGNAHVLAIRACPQLAPRPGPEFRTVTATFHHHAASVLDVAVEGLAGAIGATPNHPFWSEDKQDFVRADELTPGEQVRLADGTPRPVTAVTRRPHPEDVFNLEVQVAHTYHVSTAGVLVHNGNIDDCLRALISSNKPIAVIGRKMRRVNRAVEELVEAGAQNVRTFSPKDFEGLADKWGANRRWLHRWGIENGATIVDIGANPRFPKSLGPYYSKELEWLKVHPGVEVLKWFPGF